jgi:uncharacterized protein YndB with AHSA1/START domain
MKIVKKILFGIAILIAVVLITALFVKKDFHVEREVTIDKPTQEVFEYIRFLKNQDHFSTYTTKDPQMKKEYIGTDGTVGFIYAWDGDKNVGKGEQEIKKIVQGESLETELRFHKPMESTATAILSVEAAGANKSKVKWAMKGNCVYPFNFLQLFNMMDNMIGKEYQTSLLNLKGLLEK